MSDTPMPASGGPDSELQDFDGRELSDAEWRRAAEERFRRGSRSIAALQADMKANTEITTEVRDLLQLGKNGLRILGWLGTVAGWAMKVGVPLAAAVHFFRDSGSGAPK